MLARSRLLFSRSLGRVDVQEGYAVRLVKADIASLRAGADVHFCICFSSLTFYIGFPARGCRCPPAVRGYPRRKVNGFLCANIKQSGASATAVLLVFPRRRANVHNLFGLNIESGAELSFRRACKYPSQLWHVTGESRQPPCADVQMLARSRLRFSRSLGRVDVQEGYAVRLVKADRAGVQIQGNIACRDGASHSLPTRGRADAHYRRFSLGCDNAVSLPTRGRADAHLMKIDEIRQAFPRAGMQTSKVRHPPAPQRRRTDQHFCSSLSHPAMQNRRIPNGQSAG